MHIYIFPTGVIVGFQSSGGVPQSWNLEPWNMLLGCKAGSMYVCTYLSIYLSMCIYTHTYIYIHIYAYMLYYLERVRLKMVNKQSFNISQGRLTCWLAVKMFARLLHVAMSSADTAHGLPHPRAWPSWGIPAIGNQHSRPKRTGWPVKRNKNVEACTVACAYSTGP